MKRTRHRQADAAKFRQQMPLVGAIAAVDLIKRGHPTRMVIDAGNGRLLEETLPLRDAEGGVPSGTYWEIDYSLRRAVLNDFHCAGVMGPLTRISAR